MEDTIARGVEVALRCILIDKEFPVVKRHSPQRRKRVEKELQQEKVAKKSYKRDFLLEEVWHLFKDIFNISQDINFMLHEVASPEDVYSYEYEDGPAAQPKVTAKGGLETPAEVEQRLITKKGEVLKAACQNMHQKNKYLLRAMVLEHLIKYKTDKDKEDTPGWQWLQQLVRILGECGMSSEESDMENNNETVLHVKNMTWCHAI
ncbi:hypothetical protein BDR04DRAFT_1164260 [Suillus decipiens]|nr:hypothetical protein BDR04DRAFT_1164260 [Suillus decipiens]